MESVIVNTINEETKTFKLILKRGAAGGNLDLARGEYTFQLPYPTDDTNSGEYSNALIKLDCIVLGCESIDIGAVAPNPSLRNPNPVWFNNVVHIREALAALIMNVNIASRQTMCSLINKGDYNQDDKLYRYQELIPLICEYRGNFEGREPSPAVAPAGPGPQGNSFHYTYSPPNSTPIMCANPFGKEITIHFTNGLLDNGVRIYLTDNALINPVPPTPVYDMMNVCLQFTITLLKNK